MKKLILSVSVVLAFTACSEKPQEVQVGPTITGEWTTQSDTLFAFDEKTGEPVMVIEETKISE